MSRYGISFRDITKSFGSKTIFKQVSASLQGPSVVGIVGANGVGKSTLAKILLGKIQPDVGTYSTSYSVGYLTQDAKFSDTVTVASYLGNYCESREKYRINELLGGFGLPLLSDKRMQKRKMSSFSGGEKRRLQIIALLLQKKEILLLDEPTNHVDIHTREIFEEALEEFAGACIVVSHDKYFLGQFTYTTLWEMKNFSLTVVGRYL